MAISNFKKQKRKLQKRKEREQKKREVSLKKEEALKNLKKDFFEKMATYFSSEDFKDEKEYKSFLNSSFESFIKDAEFGVE